MKKYYQMNMKEVFEKFSTTKVGLTMDEYQKRVEKYGKNLLPKKKKDSIIKLIIEELFQPITLLLLVAIIVSLLVSEYTDAIAISFILLIDIIIGVVEENKANTTALALSNLVRVYSKVIRDGRELIVDSTNITPGDVVLLESGDKVPADIRVIESYNLTVDESTLTGESLAVLKDDKTIEKEVPISMQKNMLFASTNIVTGRCSGVVVSTGLSTEIGKIAHKMTEIVEEKSPLTIRVEKFSKQISLLIICISFFILIILLAKGLSYQEIFLSVVALSVSALPEGLPLALTMALTIASSRMSKKGVITKKLYSIESLGSCTVIASDKTGTLTVNEQMAKKILLPNSTEYDITGVGYNPSGTIIGKNIDKAKKISILGMINNEAKKIDSQYVGDSIDIAFQILGQKAKVDISNISIIDTVPYESSNQYSATFYELDGKRYCTVKGSIEKVLSFSSKLDGLEVNSTSKIYQQNEYLAGLGYRVIAIANGEVEKKDKYTQKDILNLTFMGMVGFIDPIRKEAVKSIQECKKAGIKVLMITGDHPITAFNISKELKLAKDYDSVTTGDIVEEKWREGKNSFDEFVKSKIVFSRVSPLQKLEIVESLKRNGEFVAVTGDGVNDAPALRSANIGVAMGSGTDVARESAKMIVLDDNFTSIVKGVKEGRVAYANIRKISYFLISCGFAEILFFLLSILFNMPTPLLAIQLLWLNVVTDGIQDISLSFEKEEENIMQEVPRNPRESLFDKELLLEVLVSGSFIGLLVFGVFYYLIHFMGVELTNARGYVMALMVFIQNTHVFNCRSEKNSCISKKLKHNSFVYLGVVGSIVLEIFVMESPVLSKYLHTSSIETSHLVFLFLISLSVLMVMEVYKKIRFRNH